jgi:protein-S-isoprenylcysteine O-methyltransferase Ste14
MQVSPKITAQTALALLLLAAALFVPAGTLRIPEFWLYLAANGIVMVCSLLWLPPDLLAERARPGGRSLSPAYILVALVPFGHWIVAGLDHRFHWTDTVPLWLRIAGFALVIAGFGLFYWGMSVNRFFSSVPRIQTERGHHVVTDGPYRYVRHPGYTGAIAITLGSGFALGSWLSAVVFAPALAMLLYRTLKEDTQLKAELPGYRDYAARVRWRWFPGIW